MRDSKIEGAETFAGKDSCTIVEICENVFKMLINLRPEGVVVHEHNGGGKYLRAVCGIEKVTVNQFERWIRLSVEGHPEAKEFF